MVTPNVRGRAGDLVLPAGAAGPLQRIVRQFLRDVRSASSVRPRATTATASTIRVKPLHKGFGKDTFSNSVAAGWSCNHLMGVMPRSTFEEELTSLAEAVAGNN
jgi:hypothetical protein